MMNRILSAALFAILVLSLAPQALVCGTVEKHKCSCCDDGKNCSCCSMAPLYPDQAAASAGAARIPVPDAWTPAPAPFAAPAGSAILADPLVETVHGPPPLRITSQLRI